ncbi:MAG: hypothetical protein M3Q24_01560 [bacterium]|nr:hypothetical protein [bacterium]
MKKNSTKNTLILFLILTILLVGILVFGVLFINKKNDRTKELLTTVESSSNNSLLIQSLRLAEMDPQSDLALLEQIALNRSDLISFIETLEETGRQIGINVKIASVSVEENVSSGLDKINFKIETSGNWKGTMMFNKTLENLPNKTIIDSSTLSAGEILSERVSATSTSSQTVWKSKVNFSVYSRK